MTRKSKFTESNLMATLNLFESGVPVNNVCGGSLRSVPSARTRRGESVAQADVLLSQPARSCHGGCPGKRALSFDQQREAVTHPVEAAPVPATVACNAIDLTRSSWYYVGRKVADPEDRIIEDFLRGYVARRPRRGFGK